MRLNIVFLFILATLASCVDVGAAVDEITDAIDNGLCLVRRHDNNEHGNNHNDDDEEAEDETITNDDEAYADNEDSEAEDDSGCDSDGEVASSDDDGGGDSSGADGSDDEVDSEDNGEIFEMDGDGGIRYFLGTFERQDLYYGCPDWPLVTRMYSEDDRIELVDGAGDVVASGDIFEDYTWDFTSNYRDVFGRDNINLYCTCTYTDYVSYADHFDCSCEFDNGSGDCQLQYHEMSNADAS